MPIWSSDGMKILLSDQTPLTKAAHLKEDLHLIGDSISAPSVIVPGTMGSTIGVSPIPAREDHDHGPGIMDRLYFASITTRDAYTGALTDGQIAYVASVTLHGATRDAEYVRVASAWKLYTFPFSGDAVSLAGNLPIVGGSYGSGGYTAGLLRIRNRRVYYSIHTYWGSTAGSAGSSDPYVWIMPYSRNISVSGGDLQYEVAGAGNLYHAVTGNLFVATPVFNQNSTTEIALSPDAQNGFVGSARFAGATNQQYWFHVDYDMAAAEG